MITALNEHMSNVLINGTKVSPTESKILALIRAMQLFDKVEIKYSKQGELMWQLTKTHRGTYVVDLPGE